MEEAETVGPPGLVREGLLPEEVAAPAPARARALVPVLLRCCSAEGRVREA